MLRLPQWVLTNKYPSIYDSESKTVTEQTARVYGAMNEMIDGFNQQNETIEQAVDYMQKNIVSTATEVVNEGIVTGDIGVELKYDPASEELNITVKGGVKNG